jgi:hypothetical protein
MDTAEDMDTAVDMAEVMAEVMDMGADMARATWSRVKLPNQARLHLVRRLEQLTEQIKNKSYLYISQSMNEASIFTLLFSS